MGFILTSDLELFWHLGHGIGLNIHANIFFYWVTVWAIDWALKWHGWARPDGVGLGIKKTRLLNGASSDFRGGWQA